MPSVIKAVTWDAADPTYSPEAARRGGAANA